MQHTLFPHSAHTEPSTHSQPHTPPRLRGSVGQDKRARHRARTASPQPAAHKNGLRAKHMNTKRSRSQTPSAKRTLVQVTLWVKPSLKAELQRLAEREALSVSTVGSTLLEDAIRQSIHQQYASLIQPIIEQTIAKHMRMVVTKLTWLFVRIAYDSGQTRSLVTNILGRQAGVTPSVLDTILDGSSKSARANIIKRTPQIAALIEAVEQWMQQEQEEGRPQVNG